MILYLYFARRFLVTFVAIFALFFVFYAMLDMIEIIRRFGADELGFGEVLRMTLLHVPQGIYGILPLIAILSAVTMFINLARTSELVVTRAAGRSATRTLLAPVLATLLIGVIAVSAFNPIVASTSRRYDELENRYRKGTESVLSISREGLWLRQGSESGTTVIHARKSNSDGTQLYDVSFIGFGNDGLPTFRIDASRADLTQGAWIAHEAKYWTLNDGGIPEQTAKVSDTISVPSDLTREQIQDGFGPPSTVPFWQLPAFIDSLKKAGFSARRHQVWFATELAQPILLVSMVMIGAAFTMRHTRFGRTGVMVLLALLTGFGVYFIRNFAQILGENGQLPVVIAAGAPPAAALLLAASLLLYLEGA